MEWILAILGWGTFAAAILAGLLLDAVGLFGNWIILGSTAIAWGVTGMERFSLTGLAIMLVLAVLGEVLEAVAAGYGASKFGGGKGSGISAIAGCLAGAILGTPLIPIPVVGTLIGACLGAFAAAALYEYVQRERTAQQAFWTGFGAALGRVAGLLAKLMAGLAMLAVAAFTF